MYYYYAWRNQKMCNILVTWDTILQLQILFLRLWRWWTTLDCEILCSRDTLQVLLAGFASMVWNTASKFIVLGSLDIVWLLKFWQPEQNFLYHLAIALWSTILSPFEQQMLLVASMALQPSSNLYCISSWIRLLYVHLSSFQITHRMKQCTICKHTNYHDTTNHSNYFYLIIIC